MDKGVILCVDDEIFVLQSLRDQLRREFKDEYEIELAESGHEALELVLELRDNQVEVPLIICDQVMPEMDGVTLLKTVQEQSPQTLKILMTGLASLNDIIRAVNHANLYRYISKPWDETDLILTIREALRSYEQQKQLQHQNQLLQQINNDLQREITDRCRAETKLAHDALHDPLTGLPNRASLLQALDRLLQRSNADTEYQFAVLFIDLDRFKLVNDSLGHTVGDKFLIQVVHTLENSLRGRDFVARLGGDEFTVLVENIHDQSAASIVAERILNALCTSFEVNGYTFFTSASIGVVMANGQYTNSMDLLRDADLAMYHAKASGKACYTFFDAEMHTQVLHRLHLESDLRNALVRSEFILHYQPILSLDTQQWIGFEALLRWQHPQRGFISPLDFVPLAEETGFIIPLGQWVLETACQQLKDWHTQFPHLANLMISINLSGKQLRSQELLDHLDQTLAHIPLHPRHLKLELTESMLIEDIENILETLHQLHQRGIQLSIDDFGTGYSSLSYLPRFPIRTIKIDQSFVHQMVRDAENLEVVRAIITLAHSLKLNVVAEGIETQAQLQQLKALDCELGQGYWFAKPMDAARITKSLAQMNAALSDNPIPIETFPAQI